MAGIDPPRTPLYSPGMADSNVQAALVDVTGLERSVDALIERCRTLQQDNDELRLKLAGMAAEQAAAAKVQQLARERVAVVISRLKALEK